MAKGQPCVISPNEGLSPLFALAFLELCASLLNLYCALKYMSSSLQGDDSVGCSVAKKLGFCLDHS